MATIDDLIRNGFVSSEVHARRLNIEHPDPVGLGPFCRLRVETTAPVTPGVYAWAVDTKVTYIGKASHLLHVVAGANHQRPYNDYTYVPPSKVAQTSSPRVRVNGLLNGVISDGQIVTWWWLKQSTVEDASCLEAELIHSWNPPWNLNRPQRC